MTRESSGENCIEIIHPVMAALDAQGIDGVQIMGGIGSAALSHPDTVIIPDEKRIVTSDDFLQNGKGELNPHLTRIRSNGTLRDLDVLLLSCDPDYVEQTKRLVEEQIDGQLETSVFPLHDGRELEERVESPFSFKSIASFVTDRYVMEDGKMVKALAPLFAVDIDPDTVRPWEVEVDGEEYPVVNPATAIVNYLTRSMTGLRPKDFDKVQEMARQVFGKSPEMVEYVIDGPLKSQMELAGIFQTLRWSNSWPQSKRTLDVGGILQIKSGSINGLREHEAFLLRDADDDTQLRVLTLAIIKSRVVGTGESFEKIVELYQRFAENPLDFIAKNK